MTRTSQQEQPYTGYLANNAAQVTTTLPATAKVGDIVRVSGVGAGGWKIAQNVGQAIQASVLGLSYTNWNGLITNWTQTSAMNNECNSIASAADGTKLAAVVWGGGGIYTSSNSGLTWVQPSLPNTNWSSIALLADGTPLAALVQAGGVYTTRAAIQTTTTPRTEGDLAGGQHSTVELQYIGNGQWLPLSHEGTISAYWASLGHDPRRLLSDLPTPREAHRLQDYHGIRPNSCRPSSLIGCLFQ